MKKLLCLLSLLWCFTCYAEVAVIVHPSNTNTIDADVVTRIFLGRDKTFPDGSQVLPIAQSDSAAASAEFNEKVLNRSSSQLKAYWSKLVFTGKGTAPKETENDAEMLQLIASNPNLIGYVSAASVNDSVKVILTR